MALRLQDLFAPGRIKCRLEAEDKSEVFEELVDLLVNQYGLDCRDEILAAIMRREEKMSTGIKRQHEPPRIVGDLLQAEIAEKHARSIKYQMTIAKLPLAKDIDDFAFESTPINERLVRDLAGGGFLEQQRNCVLVGGTEPAS